MTSIIAVEDLIAGAESNQFTVTEVFGRRMLDDPIMWSGAIPPRLTALLARSGIDIRRLLGAT